METVFDIFNITFDIFSITIMFRDSLNSQ